MKIIEAYGKKKVVLIAMVSSLVLIIAGVSITYAMEQNHKKEVLASIDLIFKEDTYIEYGQESIDFNEFIKEKIGEPEVILPTDEINTKELGTTELIYKVVKDGYSKDASITLEVKDTKAPEIKIKDETVTLEYGSDYDIKENIESVKDPIDGDIPYTEAAGESDYYIVEGTVDTATNGDYTVTIKAMDKNKIETEMTYTIHVKEKEVKVPSYQQPSGGVDSNIPPRNDGGESYTPPSNSVGDGGNTPPATCTANGQWKMVSNSGFVSYDYQQAWDYGEQHQFDESSSWYMYSFSVVTTMDNCGITGYTVKFRQ